MIANFRLPIANFFGNDLAGMRGKKLAISNW